MSGHGPDVASWKAASEAELKPVKIDGTMAFMVESCWPFRPTRFALDRAQPDYDAGLGRFSEGEIAVTDMTDETHDPARTELGRRAPTATPTSRSRTLPLGVFSVGGGEPRIGAAIGDLIARPARAWRSGAARRPLARRADAPDAQRMVRPRPRRTARACAACCPTCCRARPSAARSNRTSSRRPRRRMHLPCAIGDYTDFYVGIHHATNVGKQFRPDQPLLPNYKYVPIGYHGRASSVRVSGEPVIRPKGQRKPPDADAPEYGPSRRLDYELELGMFIGRGNELGDADPDRRGGGAHRRLLPAQRLVGARPAGVGISAARAVPRQEFPDHHFALGDQPRRAGAVPHRHAAAARGRPGTVALPHATRTIAPAAGSASRFEATLLTARMRDAGEPPHRAQPRRGRGRDVLVGGADRHPPQFERLQPHARRPDRHRHAVGRRGRLASGRCWRSARAARRRWPCPTASSAASSRTATN